MSSIEIIAKAIKETLAADDDEIYFRDDGDTCTVDGHVDVNALASAVLEAITGRSEYRGKPCFVLKDPDASVGLMDRRGDFWLMELGHDEQPQCQRVRRSDLVHPITEWKQRR